MDTADRRVIERIEALRPDEMDALILQLTDYADALIRWKTNWIPRGVLPEGYDASSVAMEAITRVLDGTRKWDPDKDPDLLAYLKSVVKSILSPKELLKKASREKNILHSVDESGADVIEVAASAEPGPESDVDVEELKSALLGALGDDDERLVLMSMFEGSLKAADIAADLGIAVEEVYNIKRRINRRLRAWKKGDGNHAKG